MLYSIQYMRAIAAFLVVIHHAAWKGVQFSNDPLHWFHVGSIGVDLFFIISGFIMCYTVNKKKVLFLNFIKDRFVRIIPLYWLLTSLALIGYLVFPEKINSSGGETDILASYTLFPSEGKYLINNGWTLSYEFLFYFIFSTSLLMNLYIKFLLPCLIIFTFYIFGFIINSDNYFFLFLTSHYILEFSFGILAFYIFQKNIKSFYWAVFFILISIVFVLYVNINIDNVKPNRIIQFGLPSFVFFIGVILMEPIFRTKSNFFLSRLLIALGDSSYSLYLSHIFTLVIFSVLFSYLGINENGISFILLLVIFSLVIGHICYVCVEKPLLKITKSFMIKKKNDV